MTARDLPSAAAGLLVAALGAAALAGAMTMREGPGYAAVGPRVFPLMVSAGLLLCGLAMTFVALRQPRPEVEPADRPTLGLTAAAFALYLALFTAIGFVLATVLYVTAQARIFGSRSLVRDGIAGAGLALGCYALFEGLLGLELPVGPLEALLDPIVPRLGR